MSTFGAPVLLKLISPEDRAVLARLGNRVTYRGGEIVHDHGDPGSAFGVVIEGAVALYRTRVDGHLVFVSTVAKGQNFGDVVTMNGSLRIHRVVALGPTTIDHYNRRMLDEVLSDHPGIVRGLYTVAAARLAGAVEMLDDVRMLKTEVRMAKMLRRMAERDGKGAVIHTLQDVLAQILGLSSVRTVQGLKALSKQGLLRTRYRRIEIPDLARYDAWLAEHDWE